MTTAAEKFWRKRLRRILVPASTLARRLRRRRPSAPPYPRSSGAPPVDKRRALGRGLESLLGGPRIVGPGVAPPAVLLFLTKTRLLLRRSRSRSSDGARHEPHAGSNVVGDLSAGGCSHAFMARKSPICRSMQSRRILTRHACSSTLNCYLSWHIRSKHTACFNLSWCVRQSMGNTR